MAFNIDDTIISEYAGSKRIVSIIKGVNTLIDPTADIDLFFNKIFNIATAEGIGLDYWGEIIGINRTIQIEPQGDYSNLGFEGSNLEPFDIGIFFSNSDTEFDSYILTDTAYRELLLIKAAANISKVDIGSLSKLLQLIFKDKGKCYVIEVAPMGLRYVFEFYLEPFEESLMNRRDLPPKPAGVYYDVFQAIPQDTFGFEGAGMSNFDNGVFHS